MAKGRVRGGGGGAGAGITFQTPQELHTSQCTRNPGVCTSSSLQKANPRVRLEMPSPLGPSPSLIPAFPGCRFWGSRNPQAVLHGATSMVPGSRGLDTHWTESSVGATVLPRPKNWEPLSYAVHRVQEMHLLNPRRERQAHHGGENRARPTRLRVQLRHPCPEWGVTST